MITVTSKLPYRAVVFMRILIGWHFLYEGAVKLFNPSWTSKAYLMSAKLLSPIFQWLASDSMITIVDYVNIICLLLVGLTLVLGYAERIGAIAGIVLLVMYYLAHPSLPGTPQTGTEGNYWIVNKNLIEAAAIYVIYCIPTGQVFGLKLLIKSSFKYVTR